MPSLDEFLKDTPLARPKTGIHDTVSLDVTITGADEHIVDFVHLGSHYSARREDVIDVADSKQTGVSGKPAILTFKSSARLEWRQSVTAGELNAATPFGFAMPTGAVPHRDNANVEAWTRKVGYPFEHLTQNNIVGTAGCTCDCYSNGVVDDSKWDDW